MTTNTAGCSTAGLYDADAYVLQHLMMNPGNIFSVSEVASRILGLIDRRVARAQPTPSPNPFSAFIDALRADREMQWAYHCNIAMAAYDKGVSHKTANELAALFLERLLGEYAPLHMEDPKLQPKDPSVALADRINRYVASWISSVARPDTDIAPTEEWPGLLREVEAIGSPASALESSVGQAITRQEGGNVVVVTMPSVQGALDELNKLSAAWPVLAEHASHMDGSFSAAHYNLKTWVQRADRWMQARAKESALYEKVIKDATSRAFRAEGALETAAKKLHAVMEAARNYVDALSAHNSIAHPNVHAKRLALAAAVDASYKNQLATEEQPSVSLGDNRTAIWDGESFVIRYPGKASVTFDTAAAAANWIDGGKDETVDLLRTLKAKLEARHVG